jgi:hypothetical protein
MLWPFFAERSLTPDRVKPGDVLAWVHGIGRSGRTPSSTTVGARIACLSSFYRFLIRMGLVGSNPCDAVERPRSIQSVARGYGADEVRRLLAVVPDTVAGRRDRAILLTLVLTGRRRAEVIGLRAGDLSLEGETVFYAYRGKGGKRGRRELPHPAYEAVCATLADAGKELATMAPEESLWQAAARPDGVTSGTFCRRPAWHRQASMSCATPLPSCAAMPGSRLRMSARSRSLQPCGHNRLPPSPRKPGGYELARRRGGHRAVSARPGAGVSPEQPFASSTLCPRLAHTRRW